MLALALSSLVAISPPLSARPPSTPPIIKPAEMSATEAREPDDHYGAKADDNDRMTVPAQVNGVGPYAFTLDTAANRSAISDRLATQLELPVSGGALLFSIAGPERVNLVKLKSLQIGKRQRHTVDAPVLSRDSLGSAGLIGLDALADETVLLDFRHNRISIATSPREAMVNEPDVIVVTGRSRFGELILTDAHVDGTKVYAIVDTGAQSTVGNLAFRRLMGRKGPLAETGQRIIGVTGAALPAELGSVPDIRFSDLRVRDMPVVYADVDTFRRFGVGDKPAILIGMDLLHHFERVAIDFRRHSVRFLIGRGPARVAPAVADKNEGTPTPLTL